MCVCVCHCINSLQIPTDIKAFKSYHEDRSVEPEEKKKSEHHGINDTKKGREHSNIYVVEEETVTEDVEETPVGNEHPERKETGRQTDRQTDREGGV